MNQDKLRSPGTKPVTMQDLNSEYELPRTIPQLDRLRGVAILLVLIIHAEAVVPSVLVGFVSQGWVGVDLFFVLSGFLITGILWETRDRKGYFKRFYGRRILRIWPVYILILLFAFCVVPLLKLTVGGLSLEIPKESLGIWAYLLMIQNLFARLLSSSAILVVTWSLAIEEQFYLIWPIVIRYASRRMVPRCLFAGLILAPLLRIWAMHRGFSEIAIYTNPLTHCDGLLCGATVAIWLRSARPKCGTLLLVGTILLVVGFGLFLPIRPSSVTGQYCSPFVFTAVALLSTGLLLVALVSERTGRFLHRYFFMNRTLAFFGFISYGLYLYHFFIFRLGVSEKLLIKVDLLHRPYLTHALMALCAFGFSIALAWLSRVTIERAALSRKEFFG